MLPWELAGGVAERQHWLIATWQAECVGLPRRALAKRVKTERWARPVRGITAWPGPNNAARELAAAVLTYARPTHAQMRALAVDADSDEAFIQAVVGAALGAGQAITGRSGAWIHGFAPQPRRRAIWLPSQSGRATRPDVWLRYGGAVPGTIEYRNGLPVFDPIACVLETARMPFGTWQERLDELVWQLNRADSLRLFTLDDVEERLGPLLPICGGNLVLCAIERSRETTSHSRPEHRGRELVAEAIAPLGLEPTPRPHPIFLGARRVAEADIGIVPILLDIEIDGPHHRFLDQKLADEERDRMARRAGWAVERFPDTLVKRPAVFKARIREAVEARLALFDGPLPAATDSNSSSH